MISIYSVIKTGAKLIPFIELGDNKKILRGKYDLTFPTEVASKKMLSSTSSTSFIYKKVCS
jgi:hypothetical protein